MVTIVILINLTPVQEWLAHKAAEQLSKKLKTKVSIAHLRVDFLNHVSLQGLYIEDQAHDTLLYAGEAQVRITDWFIFKDKPTLHYVALHDAYAYLRRSDTSKTWNYDFIADAFSTGKKKSGKGKPFEFDLKKVELKNVRFHMDDKWIGEDLDFDVGNFTVNADELDFNKKLLSIHDISADKLDITVNEYKGGRPARLKRNKKGYFDPSPFNVDGWVVKVKTLSVEHSMFHLNANNNVPQPEHFDEGHIAVTNAHLAADNIVVTGDTIHGQISNLGGKERSGLAIKKMRTKVTVSPIASICENLYLETNYSTVKDYYAMHYKHFPNFNSYIDSVTMVAHLKDAIVDKRDLEYFAPQLRKFPQIIMHVSGDGKGTVENLAVQHLNVTDGKVLVRGDVTMKGLPDIYKTYITYNNGEIVTTGAGILHYVPELKNSPNVAMDRLTHAYFKGSYEGYIENFSVKGAFNTNLGSLTTDIKMNIPNFNENTVTYTGAITADNLQLGTFFKQPMLGGVSLKANISGTSFNPDLAQLNLDGFISELTIKGYTYHNITPHGTLAKKQFDGKLLVDDPNLALEFDGGINYANKNVNIKATAHLLGSNFNALHLTGDTVTASADFDLDCTGSNIDNFSGYAKLNNIDLRRNNNRFAIDSVLINAGGDSLNKTLTVQSNNMVASIKGNYQLSKLPASVQYYLSRYIPNYIQAPDKFAPDQNFEFAIKTYSLDSIFAVALPLFSGFDSATIRGGFNTSAQKLLLIADIPSGSIGRFHLGNISITGLGNLDMLGLNTSIGDVAIGDSSITGSLSLTTTVANDSVRFTVATTTSDSSSSVTLNGHILARKDSLFLTLAPSQFYLNQVKWDIAGGSKVVYSDKYLLVEGFKLTSGLQKITAATELQGVDKSILINTENLDLGQLGSWAGLAMYQPDGRVNGTIKIDKVFQSLFITANIRATDVKLANDTVGTINIIGTYDGAQKLVNLDPQTGIYRDNASVVASGKISFDSTTHQKLDGSITFNNAPVTWAQPFLVGVMSHLSGTVNGSVGFNGTSRNPEINGVLTLEKAGLRVDYMGCDYTIPLAMVTITNKRIEVGKVPIYDRFHNQAVLTGHFSHNLFNNMRMRLQIQSRKIEVMNLTNNDNNIFYGNVIAGIDSFNIRGPFNNIRMSIAGISPAAKSVFYLPVSSGGEVGTYTYATFKNYGSEPNKPTLRKNRNRIDIEIDANLNPDVEMHVVLDPSTGDEIMANGYGRLLLSIPPANDMSIQGTYTIDNGLYRFTFPQFFITRQFRLKSGSTISFNGPFSDTHLDVDAVYAVKARLYDVLGESEKQFVTGNELIDARAPQLVDVLLHMSGSLVYPKLTFDLDLEDKHSQSTYAYTKLRQINYDERAKINQVASLLLIGDFVPPDGITGSTVATGAINNVSQILSKTTSTALTTILNKITGDKKLNVDVRYINYNYNDQSLGGLNRNLLTVGVNKSYFNDRLLVEVGSTSNWGRPSSTSTSSSFNLSGDFRIQYKLTQTSGLRLNAFRTSDYDVTLDRDIVRSGVGIAWHKSFDNLTQFFRGNKYAQREKMKEMDGATQQPQPDTARKSKGTE